MAIHFHPQPGTILICDFDGLKEPEMVKRRPVVVISPRLRNRGNLVTVVPLSSTRPGEVCQYHHRLAIDPPLPHPYADSAHWIKADMVYTVAFHRLFLPSLGKDANGVRQYDQRVVEPAELDSIRQCVLHSIGMGALIKPP